MKFLTRIFFFGGGVFEVFEWMRSLSNQLEAPKAPKAPKALEKLRKASHQRGCFLNPL